MKSSSSPSAFFQQMVMNCMQRDQLEMVGLFLNGEPIAIECLLRTESGGFAYKLAFDENYQKHSPGMLLQLNIMQRYLDRPDPFWLDSCAAPDHQMINRIWLERRSIEHLLVSTGGPLANLSVGVLPFMRAIKRELPTKFQQKTPANHRTRHKTGSS